MKFSLATHHSPLLLAAAAPDATFTGSTVLVICVVGGFVITVVTSIISLVIAARRKPALGEEIYKEFVRRGEWSESVVVIHNRIDRNKKDIEDIGALMNKAFKDMEGAVGRLEGIVDILREQSVRQAATHVVR